MKKVLFAMILAVLTACGGGGSSPAIDRSISAETSAKLAALKQQREREHAQLCIYACGSIPGAETVFYREYGSTSGSRYYQEGDDVILRFDDASNTLWTEYTLLEANGTHIEVQMHNSEGYVANVDYTFGTTGTNNAAVLYYTETLGRFTAASTTVAPKIGMRVPQINHFSNSLVFRDLFYDPA